jgi:hypothetical protein
MWKQIDERVSKNTDIYSRVFGVYPDNKIDTVADVKTLKEAANIELYDELKGEIKGFGVDFPLNFLNGENLRKIKHFEFGLFLLPSHIFT